MVPETPVESAGEEVKHKWVMEFPAETCAGIPLMRVVDPSTARLHASLDSSGGQRSRRADEDASRRQREHQQRNYSSSSGAMHASNPPSHGYAHIRATKRSRSPSGEYDGSRGVRIKNPRALSANVMWNCKLCDRECKPAKMREHVAAHLIEAVDLGEIHPDTCGYCGTHGDGCVVSLEQGSARGILVPYSTCDFFYKFNLKSASKLSSPCSNVPLRCPGCPDEETVYWKYNLRVHCAQKHPELRLSPEDLKEFSLNSTERDRLQRKNLE